MEKVAANFLQLQVSFFQDHQVHNSYFAENVLIQFKLW